jgi:hypothetical protein
VLVYASGSQLVPAVHPNLLCNGPNPGDCPLAQASAVSLNISTPTQVDFTLQRSGGLIIQPQLTPQLSADIFRANGTFLFSTSTYGSPSFVSLTPGSYLLRFKSDSTFAQVWPDIDCLFPCLTDLANATPLQLGSGEIRTLTPMLRRLPTMRVTLRDRISQSPIAGQAIVRAENSFDYSSAVTDASGIALLRVPPGRIQVFANSNQHIDQAFPGVPCKRNYNISNADLDCPGVQSINIDLNSPDSSDVLFNLDRSAAISGLLNGAATISVFSVSGQQLFAQQSYTRDRYQFDDLPPGSYKFGVAGYSIFSQLYRFRNCPLAGSDFGACNFADAETVTLTNGEQRNDIDFKVRARQAIRGQVSALETGAAIDNMIIDFWARPNASAAPTIVMSTRTDVLGNFEVISQQPVYLSTDVVSGYIDQIYPQIPCPNGSAASGACAITQGQMLVPVDSLLGGEISIKLRSLGTMQNGFED